MRLASLLNFDGEGKGCSNTVGTGDLNLTTELMSQFFANVQTKTDTIEVVRLTVLENTVRFEELGDVLSLDTDASVFDEEHEGLSLDLVRVENLDKATAGELNGI